MRTVEPPDPVLPSSAMAVRTDTAISPQRTLFELDSEDAVLVGVAFTNTPGSEAVGMIVGVALGFALWGLVGAVPGVIALAAVIVGLGFLSKRRIHQGLITDLGVSDDDARALAKSVRRYSLDDLFGSNELPALQRRGQRLIERARALRAKAP